MSLLNGLKELFSREEPDFEHTNFEKFEDSLQNFQMFYPCHWKYEKNTAIIEGAYAINFSSTKSRATLRVEVDTRLPFGFSSKKFEQYAKDEIEKPTAGIISTACKMNLTPYECMGTKYEFTDGSNHMHGEKILFYTGDRIFSLLLICHAADYDRLKKTFAYVVDSFKVKPKKMMLA
jgi:hypothetical protein